MNAVSLRGLFRATGKTGKPVAVRSSSDLAGAYEKADYKERDALDYDPTPPEPTRALVAYEGDWLRDFPLVWEAACGDGRMMRDLAACGVNSVGSDIVDRGCDAIIQDFFEFKSPLAPAIVTNPPYNLINFCDGKGKWVMHAVGELGVEYMALLLSWNWPGAGGLASIWSAYPPARVYLMRWKIDFTGQGAPPMLNAWFIWDKKHKGETLLRMMDRINPQQSEMRL